MVMSNSSSTDFSRFSAAAKPLNRLATLQAHMAGSSGTVFTKNEVPQAPEDPLFGLMAAYRKDSFDKKVDLGIGAYRDDSAKPWVLPVVKKVQINPSSFPILSSAHQFRLHLGGGNPEQRPKPEP
jgi:aspartate aminotransferase